MVLRFTSGLKAELVLSTNKFDLPGRRAKSTEKMKLSGKQITAARDLLGITQAELAKAIGVTPATIFRFESAKHEPYPATVAKIRAELERRGIEFSNGTGIGVRLNYEKAAEFARTVASARNESDR